MKHSRARSAGALSMARGNAAFFSVAHGYRSLRFSDAACLGPFVFLTVRTIGAHGTCSDVPHSEARAA
jgi:hypothetical protein